MKNQNTKNYKIGDVNIYISKATKDYIIFRITGRENGFETGVKLSIEKAKVLYHAILDSKHVSPSIRIINIDKVHAKNREYTKLNDEPNFTYKYYESKNAEINVISKGGYCIVSISADKDYRTFSFIQELMIM